jgi:methionyl-tRNA formyltransferase
MADPLRIVFAGTPEFSVPPLQALIDSEHQVVAVYTQPDRPAGRGRKLTPSPVKQQALDHNIPVFQPRTLRDQQAVAELAALAPDLMVVVAYGLLLPPQVLAIPPLGCINIHASLLPRWRGAAPIQRAIEAGDRETGVSIMRMEEGLDTGPVYLQKSIPIGAEETGGSLHDRLSLLGAAALM